MECVQFGLAVTVKGRVYGTEGIEYCHGKDLHYAAKQFQGWPCKRRDGFRLKAHRIVDQHLELGVTAILRQNDYKDLYKGQPNPRKLREDSMTTHILYVVSVDVVDAFFHPLASFY